MATFNCEWDISSCILGSNTWVYLPTQFFQSKSDKIGFDLALQMDFTSNSLKVLVKKNDSRSAKASVEVELLRRDKDLIYGGYDYDEFGDPISYIGCSYYVFEPETNRSIKRIEISDWQKLCTFVSFTNLSPINSDVITKNACCIKLATIRCKITGFRFIFEGATEIKYPKSCVQQNFHQFLKADLFSDVVLVVDDQELPAHKIVLSTHSQFFYKMLTTDMKESKDNRIEIKNFSADLITEMLEYFYTNKTKASNDFTVAVKLIELAEMYQIIRLKDICQVTMSENINIVNVLTILCIADDYNLPELLEKAESFLLENKDKIVELAEFKNLFSSRPLLMYRLFMCAIK